MEKFLWLLLLWLPTHLVGSSIILHKESAEVWHYQQELTATLVDFAEAELRIHHDQSVVSFSATTDNFSFKLILRPGPNRIWVESSPAGRPPVSSEPVTLTLMYTPEPLLKPYTVAKGNRLQLKAEVLENPYNQPLSYYWLPDAGNPAATRIRRKHKKRARVRVPEKPGKYYFNLGVVAGSDTSWFQTYASRTEEGLKPFVMETHYSDWIDQAVIYEITPYKFMPDATFEDIRQKLPEIKELGVNTLWIQPVFETRQFGQGYDIIDYFALRTDLGPEEQFAGLIRTAKFLGFKVLLDIVPNHTSVHHPYALAAARGAQSHYYGYYQHENDSAIYSSSYHRHEDGFIYYFWNDLVNLNYDNPEVQRWMIEACKHWLLKYGLDGYRFDAAWGVNARKPGFGRKLQAELKSLKPGILLLAEDKAADTTLYSKGFDAAYDWTMDTSWISQWAWQYEFDEDESLTIFKYPEAEHRGQMLADAVFRTGNVDDLKLRFMENNDLARFIAGHSLGQTRMVAALLFSLPGIPMLYNGQEIGRTLHPYSPGRIFRRGMTIRAQDSLGLFDYYSRLTGLRLKHPALHKGSTREIALGGSGSVFAFERCASHERIVVVLNMADEPVQLPPEAAPMLGLTQGRQLTDLLSGQQFDSSGIPIEGWGIRWFLVEQ